MANANDRQVGGAHYREPIQHWDYVLANGIPYMEAQIIKYVGRWRKKNGIQDLEKARHFLEKLLEVTRSEARIAQGPQLNGSTQGYDGGIQPEEARRGYDGGIQPAQQSLY